MKNDKDADKNTISVYNGRMENEKERFADRSEMTGVNKTKKRTEYTAEDAAGIGGSRLENLPEPLLIWFGEHARVLPWRERPLPYYVWVSEIMLQQTRVEAVKPFFARFTQALPDVASLAVCQEERLLKLWEGLGYYNRVRNMQKAAQLVMENYGGELPASYSALLGLPGIGSYTAGAIASIAYGKKVPAVDGNVLRVISRITGDAQDVMKQSVKRQYEDRLREIMPEEAPGVFNQALMELGATVCLPNGAPECERCPVKDRCYAKAHDCQMELPVKAPKKARRVEKRTVLVIRDSERALIRKRPSKGLLAGLYELPNLEGWMKQREALDYARDCGFRPIRIMPLPDAKHIFSHVEWQMTGYMVQVEDAEDFSGSIFIEPARTEREYPIPAAFSAYVKYLSIRLGQEKYEKGSEMEIIESVLFEKKIAEEE